MTTREAERRYEAEHVRMYAGRAAVIHNPHGKPVEDLPTIYGFNNGGGRVWWDAQLIAEDGTCLGAHCCSSEAYMPADLGIVEGTRPDRHDTFRAHYPDGYKMEFVGYDAVGGHAGLMAAIAKANAASAMETAR